MLSEAAAITGRLEATSFFDLCHLLLPRKGCLILDRADGLKAKVWLSTGSVLDAQIRTLVGYDAFMEIARLHAGNFKFVAGVDLPAPAIEQPYSKLALDAALYVDLWSNLALWNVDEHTVIARHGYRASKEHEVFITQEVVDAWNFLHGPMTVEAVMAAVSAREDTTRLDALNAIHHLLTLGVVRPEIAQQKPTPRVVARPAVAAPATSPATSPAAGLADPRPPLPTPRPLPAIPPPASAKPAPVARPVPVPKVTPAPPTGPATPPPHPITPP